MSGKKGSPHRRYPKRSSRTNPRSSERLQYKGLREFVLPNKADILDKLVPEGTSPKNYKHLRPRKLVNNLVKERNSYNNPDGIDLFDDDTLEDFVDDSVGEVRPRKRERTRKSSASEWEESNNEEYSEGSAVSESDDVLEDDPKNDTSSNSYDDSEPPVAVLSSTDENESDEKGSNAQSVSDAQSVSSMEGFMENRVKKSLRKLPKRVTASTWWKTNKGPLSASTKQRRQIRRLSIDLSDSDEDSSSPHVKQRQRRRMTISDEEEEDKPSCSKVKKDSQSEKKSTQISDEDSEEEEISDRTATNDDDHVSDGNGHEDEEDEDSPISRSKARHKKGAKKSKTNRTPIIDEECASEDKEEEETSPDVRKTRHRSTPHGSKRPKAISSSEDSDKTSNNSVDSGKTLRARKDRKRIKSSDLLSSEESENELPKSSRSKRGQILNTGSTSSSSERECSRTKTRSRTKSYGLDDDDDFDFDLAVRPRRKIRRRAAKRHRSYFIDEDDEEDEIERMRDDEEVNTTDDLGNNSRNINQDSNNDRNCDLTGKPSDGSKQAKSNDDLQSRHDASINDKDIEPKTALESEVIVQSRDQHKDLDLSMDGEASSNNPKSHMEQNAELSNKAMESTELDVCDRMGILTRELVIPTKETDSSVDNNAKDMTESEVAQGRNDVAIETGVDHARNQTNSNSLLEEVLDGIVPLVNDLNSTGNERESIDEVVLDTARNDTSKDVTSAPNDSIKDMTSEITPSDISKDIASDAAPVDNKDAVKNEPEPNYESDDSIVECAVPPKTPPIEITLSSDDDDPVPPPVTTGTGNTNTPVGQPHAFPMAYNSSGGTTGRYAFTNQYRPPFGTPNVGINHSNGGDSTSGRFPFGASNVGNNRNNGGTATQGYVNQATNIPPNYQTTNQLGNSTQSSMTYNTTNVAPVFHATSAGNGQFQQQDQQQAARGWHQTNNSQSYQSGNRLPTGNNAQYSQSFTNTQTANCMSSSSSDSVAAPSNFWTVHRSGSGTQVLVRNNSGATQQPVNVNKAQYQHDLHSSNTLMSRVETESNNQPHSYLGNHALLRNLLKTDTTFNSHMGRGNGICAQQFPTPNLLQTSSSKTVTNASSSNYQGRDTFQGTRNYIQERSTADGMSASTTGVVPNYQANPFAMTANPARQQSIHNSSDESATMPRNYIHPSTMSNHVQASTARIPAGSIHRVVQATGTARIPVGSNHQANPFGMSANTNTQQLSRGSNAQCGAHATANSSNYQAISRTQGARNTNSGVAQYQQIMSSIGNTGSVSSQHNASNYQFSNRTQRSGYPTQTDPQVLSTPSASTGIVRHGPISQAVNSFQMRGNTLKQHNLPVGSGVASNMTGGAISSNYQSLNRISGTSTQPQTLHRTNVSPTERMGSVINAQSVNQYQVHSNIRQHQTVPSVNPTPASMMGGSPQSGTNFQTPVNRLHAGSHQSTSALGTGLGTGNHGLHTTMFAHHQATPSATNTSSTSSTTLSMNRVQQSAESIQLQRLRNATNLLKSFSQTGSTMHKQSTSSVSRTEMGVSTPNQWNRYQIQDHDIKPVLFSNNVVQLGDQRVPARQISASSVESIPSVVSINQNSDGTRIFNVLASKSNSIDNVSTGILSQMHVNHASELSGTNGVAFSSMQRASSQPDIHSQPMLARHPASNVNLMLNERHRGLAGGSQPVVSPPARPVVSTFLNRPKRKKPVVILRDILSQINSVNFGDAGETTRSVHIEPGKKFLIQENGDGQDIIPLNKDSTATIRIAEDASSSNARLRHPDTPVRHPPVSSEHGDSITNGSIGQPSTILSNPIAQDQVSISATLTVEDDIEMTHPTVNNAPSRTNANPSLGMSDDPSQDAGRMDGICSTNQRSNNNIDKMSSDSSSRVDNDTQRNAVLEA